MLQLQNARTPRAIEDEDEVPEVQAIEDEDEVPEVQTAKRRVVELPLEMHLYIIGFLVTGSDAGTIFNCALVCRRWLPVSLFKLYDDIILRYRWQWIAFKRLVLHPSSSMRGYLPRVRTLHVDVQDKEYFDKEGTQPRIGWGKEQERPWGHAVLNQCAIQLEGLTHICFWQVDWSCAPDMALLCGSNYRSLTKLVLDSCTFTNGGQLLLLVTAFPALDALCLWNIISKSSKPLQVSYIPKAPHSLARLDLNCADDVMAIISRWLVHSQLVRKLSCIEWMPDDARKGSWKTFAEVIDGPSLQELNLYVPYDAQADLTRFTNLKIFTLHWIWITDEGWDHLNQTVSSISSTRLEELHIDFWDSNLSSLDSILPTFAQLKTIDDTLARPHFAQLRHVKLLYKFNIPTQAIPITSDTSPLSPSRDGIAPSPGSSSQPDPSNELVDRESDLLDHDLRDPQHPFRLYAEQLVRHGIQEGLKQLVTRGRLDVEVKIELSRPSDVVVKSDGNTKESATVTTPPDIPTANEPAHSTTVSVS